MSGVFSISRASGLSADSQGTSWDVEDFIKVHKLVRKSGKHNFESCKIPIPTAIRHDRIREALGEEVTPKEECVLKGNLYFRRVVVHYKGYVFEIFTLFLI